ncbi:GNAT family N-acetyltransferase [Hymenobacter terrenus]|uniref:GNAT family N-acetyltransferase n=1 Tax=Hymenobacter terrenus TaxID=1629124 RepID=UPI00061907A6|nr:GNAT family N-acetyltransferase [Hymenobacter terrenus]
MENLLPSTTTDFRLTTATPADAAHLTLFVNRAYRGETARQGWTSEADLLDGIRIDEAGLREMLALPKAAMLLCLSDENELLGCFHVQANGALLYLSMLAVAPTQQGQGVGKFLLRSAEDYGRQHGCAVSRMTVISVRSELIAYYGRQGYHPTGATEPFPADPRYSIPRQPLHLLVLEKPLT